MWRCSSRVLEEGLEYYNQPERLVSTLKKYLFKIGFQGTVGKVWNAILSLPEATKFKLCLAADEKCKYKGILQQELKMFNSTANRIIINPEFVQQFDQSDGSLQFDDM